MPGMPRFTGFPAALALILLACSSAPHAGHTTSMSGTGTGGEAGTGGEGTGGGGTGGSGTGGSTADAGSDAEGTGTPCSVGGNAGTCMDVADCAKIADHTSTPGYCPGPANIECCTPAGSVADNPPVPAGWKLMMQSDVTPEMTSWAVAILDDPTDYPMFSTAMMTFGTLLVMARVEWHPPDFQNMKVHRGVTLYEPA